MYTWYGLTRGVLIVILIILVAVLLVGGLILYILRPAAPPTNPFARSTVHTHPWSQACEIAAELEGSAPDDAERISVLCEAPQAIWLGEWTPDVGSAVSMVISEAQTRDAMPLFVVYNIPERDATGEFSEGGLPTGEAYLDWIEEIAQGIDDATVAIVLEPDALAGLDELTEERQEERISLIEQAVEILAEGQNTAVYIDAGNVPWQSADLMASRLERAGIEHANGFALNVSNFLSTEKSIGYGEVVAEKVEGEPHFIIDSSRNGLGHAPDFGWCNPPGRALGRTGYVPDHQLVDWVGWIKAPGESDGECNGGPPSGEFWTDYALGLVERAEEHDTLN